MQNFQKQLKANFRILINEKKIYKKVQSKLKKKKDKYKFKPINFLELTIKIFLFKKINSFLALYSYIAPPMKGLIFMQQIVTLIIILFINKIVYVKHKRI